MDWQDTAPRRAISFGAAVGLPANPTLFRVCILRVAGADPLPPAFTEFWRRVLVEGPRECSDRWEVLLFAMNLLGGGFTCVFTDRDLRRDEPPVFKFAAGALEAACYALPAREPGDPRGQEEYDTLEYECLDHIRAAALAEPVAGLLRAVRETRAFDCVVCDFYRTERRPLTLV